LNGYYDFNTVKGFRPFLGVGLGQADIQNAKDKELAMSFLMRQLLRLILALKKKFKKI